ncbi:MAG TPA: hydrogenase maturation nickel metallochaperone HypA [Candidatus Bathyarchaeia archaeon]|nr:hydrogenase maturation nickel metallochaperone HypA [Candidatus Bathyarchaeia archaeon]
MHEFSVTSQIVQSVLTEAEKREAKKVTEVNLVIGKLTFLGLEQVRFAFEALTKGTIIEGSKLIIEEQEGIVKCGNCGYEGGFKYQDDPLYHVPVPTLSCPKCNNAVHIAAGKECTIRNIKMLV